MVVTKPYGFTVEQINMSCPEDLQPYVDAYVYEEKLIDQRNWFSWQYGLSAVSVAVEHNLAGRKARSKYIDKPLMQEIEERNGKFSESELKRQREAFMMGLKTMQANFELAHPEKKKGAVKNGD